MADTLTLNKKGFLIPTVPDKFVDLNDAQKTVSQLQRCISDIVQSLQITTLKDGDVISASNLTDNALVRGDGGAKGVQTTTVLVDDSNRMTNVNQPAFMAFKSSTSADQTGDGTAYAVVCDTEVFDQGGGYNNSTGTFTAPVMGRYLLAFTVWLAGLLNTHNDHQISIATSNRNYYFNDSYNASSNPFIQNRTMTLFVVADMDASDTATTTLQITGGTKVVDIVGHAYVLRTYASGCLFC